MASGFGTEDIAIDSHKTDSVKIMTEKIERLFTGVKITFELGSNAEKKQWIAISGTHQFRQNAKEYITAVCNPEFSRNLVTRGKEKLDAAAVEGVERDTSAVITVLGQHTLRISGSAYPFVTALSKLESMYPTLKEETENCPEKSKQSTLEDKRQLPGNATQTDQCVEICIARLPVKRTKDEVTSLLAEYNVKQIQFKKKPKKDFKFAFVKLSSLEEAERVIRQLNGLTWKGQKLEVRQSNRQGKTCIVVEDDGWLTSPQNKFKGAVGASMPGQSSVLRRSSSVDTDDWSDMEDMEEEYITTDKKNHNPDPCQEAKVKDTASAKASSSKTGTGSGAGAAGKKPPSPARPKSAKGGQTGIKPPRQAATGTVNSVPRSCWSVRVSGPLSCKELVVDGPEYELVDPDSIDEDLLFESGDPVIVLPENADETKALRASLLDSSYKSVESSLGALCKKAVLSGYAQDEVEMAVGFLDYSDRDITYDELVATILAVQQQGEDGNEVSERDSPNRKRSSSSCPPKAGTSSPDRVVRSTGGRVSTSSSDIGQASGSSDKRKSNSSADLSVIMIDDEDNMLRDMNDSVIFVREDHHTSVCLADGSPKSVTPKQGPGGSTQGSKVWMEHRSPQKSKQSTSIQPGWPGPVSSQTSSKTGLMNKPSSARAGTFKAAGQGNTAASSSAQLRNQQSSELSNSSGCKRKSLSDDEDQTYVMKPIGSDGVADSSRPGSGDIFPGNSTGGVALRTGTGPGNRGGGKTFGAGLGPVQNNALCFTNRAGETLFDIVVDGSNVAMCHGDQGQGKVFSCRGIEICANYFLRRGHQVIVWVPLWRRYRQQPPHQPIRDQDVLERLERKGVLKFTPARKLPNGQLIASHEDKWVLDLAVEIDAVVVSNDHFREFADKGVGYEHILLHRLLPYQFVNDLFMPTPDPLGRHGPLLNDFLHRGWEAWYNERRDQPPMLQAFNRQPPMLHTGNQQYLGRPPAPQQSWNRPRINQQPPRRPFMGQQQPVRFPSGGFQPPRPLPFDPQRPAWTAAQKIFKGDGAQQKGSNINQSPERHPTVTADLMKALKGVFPEEEQEVKIRSVLENHSSETDLNRLTNYCYSALFL